MLLFFMRIFYALLLDVLHGIHYMTWYLTHMTWYLTALQYSCIQQHYSILVFNGITVFWYSMALQYFNGMYHFYPIT